MLHFFTFIIATVCQICPGLNADEIQIPYHKHHKVSSLVKNTKNSVKYKVRMSNNRAKYEVLIKQYFRAILEISAVSN